MSARCVWKGEEMKRKILLVLAFMLMLQVSTGCTEEEDPGLANPASVYCEEQGGTLDLRTTDEGTVGYCVFSDGSECEEWAYYRGECTPGQ